MARMHSLVIENVHKSFGNKKAVQNLSLAIPEGAIYGFLGPNGAGKTTTIRMIMSILKPDAGTITLLGSHDTGHVKHRLGYLPEEKGLYKKMKAREIIAYFGRLKGMNRSDAVARADRMLDQYGLGDAKHERCDALSKGMGQKVQILATLLHDPDFVILDEPFSGLDPINVELVRQLILDLKSAGKTVIFSTHIMEQAESLCDYVTLINHGIKLLDGTVAEVKQQSQPTAQVTFAASVTPEPLNGVTRINNMGNQLELTLTGKVSAQDLLAQLMTLGEIRSFAIKEPSLHEIFVRTIGEQP